MMLMCACRLISQQVICTTRRHTNTLHLFFGCSRLWRYMKLTRRRFISFDLHTIVVVIQCLELAYYDTSTGTHARTHTRAKKYYILVIVSQILNCQCTTPGVIKPVLQGPQSSSLFCDNQGNWPSGKSGFLPGRAENPDGLHLPQHWVDDPCTIRSIY